jgi:hypothetical protein
MLGLIRGGWIVVALGLLACGTDDATDDGGGDTAVDDGTAGVPGSGSDADASSTGVGDTAEDQGADEGGEFLCQQSTPPDDMLCETVCGHIEECGAALNGACTDLECCLQTCGGRSDIYDVSPECGALYDAQYSCLAALDCATLTMTLDDGITPGEACGAEVEAWGGSCSCACGPGADHPDCV